MNKLTISILTAAILGSPLSAFADDGMQSMDMSKMPMTSKVDSKIAQGVGVIKSIDDKTDTIVLSHQPIQALNWPAMSMGFKVADHKLLNGFKVGQKVNFALKAEGAKQIVTELSIAK